MLNQEIRAGNITSSECFVLLDEGSREMTKEELAQYKIDNPKSKKTTIADGFSEAALEYIEERNMERKLNRSLDTDVTSRPLSWGLLLEEIYIPLLGDEYKLCSQETYIHPDFDYWVGSKDAINPLDRTIVEAKSPFTLKSFCRLVNPIYDGLEGVDAMRAIRDGYTVKVNGRDVKKKKHIDGKKYYSQVISNSCIEGSSPVEFMVFMPYKSELEAIRHYAQSTGNPNYMWIWGATDNELPHIPDEGYYSHINIIRFDAPKEDKELLTKRIEMAGKYLIPRL